MMRPGSSLGRKINRLVNKTLKTDGSPLTVVSAHGQIRKHWILEAVSLPESRKEETLIMVYTLTTNCTRVQQTQSGGCNELLKNLIRNKS